MDKDTRNAIERATQRARKLLEEDFAAQLEGDFDIHRDGAVATKPGPHLTPRQALQRERIVAALQHKRAAGMTTANAARDYLRDAAFTTLNRFVALKMLEARELVQECITKGEQSAGYREFCGMAPGLPLLPDSVGYRLYIESLFDELSTEVKVLFDRRDPSSVLWPKRATFEKLLEILNASELTSVWTEDETIGWVYQFFNGQDERRKMREESQAPRNSRELAVRNQFFTPRYVVQFLTDNTLGRIWYEMRGTKTVLAERCEYMVRKPREEFAPRAKKDPRDIRVLDPACGSGHFLLYAFDLLLMMYEEAYLDSESPKSEATGRTLADEFESLGALRRAAPELVVAYNLHGVDIDPRCAQIAQLALWMRAQKAYRDFGISRADRPQIRRSNIVIAESFVADEQLAKEFIAKLGDSELARVFTTLVESLNLAGEMGLLLRVEQLVVRQAKRGQTDDLFAPLEERIRTALARFVSDEGGRANTRRRLFVDDAAHGLALLHVAEKKFDVVLMNPPYGDLPPRIDSYVRKEYPASWKDCAAALVERGLSLLVHGGLLGVLSTATFLSSKQLRDFRAAVRPLLLVNHGLGVLDGATVETASWITAQGMRDAGESCTFIELEAEPSETEASALLSIIASVKAGSCLDRRVISHRVDAFKAIPNEPFAYYLRPELLELWSDAKCVEPEALEVAAGITTFDNERFLRLRHEVCKRKLPERYRYIAKGGEYSPFLRDEELLVDWLGDGALLQANELARYNTTARTTQSKKFWFRKGITFSNVSSVAFGARILPEGSIFTTRGMGIFLRREEDLTAWLALLNSTLVEELLQAFSRGRMYEVRAVAGLPWPRFFESVRGELNDLGKQALRLALAVERTRPTSVLFQYPENRHSHIKALEQDAERVLEAIDSAAERAYLGRPGFSYSVPRRKDLKRYWIRIDGGATADIGFLFLVTFTARAVDSAEPDRSSLDSSPPWNMLSGTSGAEALEGNGTAAAIAHDDPGGPNDVISLLRKALEEKRAVTPGGFAQETIDLFADDDRLRRHIAKQFFSEHLSAFSRSQRRAPVFWQLAIPSGRYSVWLYLHSLSRDTLFRIQNDYTGPKLAFEERRLASLTRELSERATAAQRKELAIQETFVEELRAHLDEVKRVAPLWNPNLDDGVIINFAPLWRLVPHHKPWQKELKATWDALCEGRYDWAHLAMHLWPERVVPKCAKDRSLAIAHGLEEVFWVEGSDGKWTARKAPTRSVDALVRERTSPAVKSALKSLLDAPAASGDRGRGRGARRQAAVATEGGQA